MAGQPNVRLDQNTGLYIPGDDQPLLVRLLYGAAYFFSRHPRTLTINTPFVDAAVEGTEFLVKVEAERTLIVVFAGRVRASNPQGELTIGHGEAASAEAGQAPSALCYRPAARRRAVDAILSVDPAGAGRSLRCFGASAAGAAARRRGAGGGGPTAGGVRPLRGDPRERNATPTIISIGRGPCSRSGGWRRRGRTSVRR